MLNFRNNLVILCILRSILRTPETLCLRWNSYDLAAAGLESFFLIKSNNALLGEFIKIEKS